MKETDTSRRQFLAGAALTLSSLVVSAGLPRFVGVAGERVTAQNLLDSYSPVFFEEHEWRALVPLCDLLIPEDETGPGAIATLVPVYIDRQMNTEYGNGGLWYMQGPFYPDSAPQFGYQHKFTPREIYRIGLREVDAYCRQNRQNTFADLVPAAQSEILTGLQDGSISLPTMPGTIFFTQLLTNVKEGFLADPMYGGNKNMAGWKLVGFPGAQGDYRQAIRMHNQDLNIPPVSIARAKAGAAPTRTPVAVPAPCAPVTPVDPCAPVAVPCDPCAPSTPVTVYRKGC